MSSLRGWGREDSFGALREQSEGITMERYFDCNATTALVAAAREAWLTAQGEHWHNPSSLYREAGQAKRRLEEAREAFGGLLGVDSQRIVFTSGATEGCNGVFASEVRTSPPDTAVLVSAIEHPCVREAARKWFGAERVRELPVDSNGAVDLEEARRAIATERPALVSVMAANNETGVLQPWREVAELCREHGVRYHCDAVQWVGKQRDSDFGCCGWVAASAHKFGGPKGVGLLVIPEDTDEPMALQAGGPQESGHRGGTESYPDIAAMLAALQSVERSPEASSEGRDAFEAKVRETVPGARTVGAGAPRLANTSMLIMPAHGNLKWLTRLSERGFAVSTGSACSSGRGNPSHVMAAMGLGFDEMGRVLRFSGGPATTADEWLDLAAAVEEVWAGLEMGQRTRTKVNLADL